MILRVTEYNRNTRYHTCESEDSERIYRADLLINGDFHDELKKLSLCETSEKVDAFCEQLVDKKIFVTDMIPLYYCGTDVRIIK